MSRAFYILFVLTLFLSCAKKELPPDMEGEVKFFWRGTFDNENSDFSAGKNGFYFKPDFISQTNENIYIASFKKENSSEALTIKFFTTPNSTPEQIFIPGQIPIGSGSASGHTYAFQAIPDGSGPYTYFWDFGDGTTSTQANPVHSYQNPGMYPVKLIITYNNCVDSFENVINTAMDDCSGSFTFTTGGSTVAQFQAQANNPLFATYMWDFGDGTGGNGPNPLHQYNALGVYRVCVTISNSPACQSTYCQQVDIGNISSCITNFSYTLDTSQVIYPYVVIEYTDESGSIFSSEYPQPSGNFFEILSRENHEKSGSSYFKLNIKNSSRLFDKNNPASYFDISGEGMIAVEK